MTENCLCYQIPAHTSLDEAIQLLGHALPFGSEAQIDSKRIFYDSFDWRLYDAGWILELETLGNRSVLYLERLDGGDRMVCAVDRVPRFASDLPKALHRCIGACLGIRALLPVSVVQSSSRRFDLTNRDGKRVLRISFDENRMLDETVEEGSSLGCRVRLFPVKGYPKVLKKARTAMLEHGFACEHASLLSEALESSGRRPMDYTSKFDLKLEPEMRAGEAVRKICARLLASIEANRSGTIENLDSEFLHDLRVAVRRTRSVLSQLKSAFPTSAVERFSPEFAWLGQITGEPRDLDVYLLTFDRYKASLPITIRGDLDPLYEFIALRREGAHTALVKNLTSDRYGTFLAAWKTYLQEPIGETSHGSVQSLAIKTLADRRIWRVYKRVLREGQAIGADSPATALHDLRKTCKKLRYVLEFFSSLYPRSQMKSLLKTLKGLQENLGDFQDFEVQRERLKQFSQEMMAAGETPAATLLAMGVLVQELGRRSHMARLEFSHRFEHFQSVEHRAQFKRLFKDGGKGGRR